MIAPLLPFDFIQTMHAKYTCTHLHTAYVQHSNEHTVKTVFFLKNMMLSLTFKSYTELM